MKKKTIVILTLVGILLLSVAITLLYNKNNMMSNVTAYIPEQNSTEKNDWTVLSSSKDSCFLEVCYQEKYGFEKTIHCKAIFENVKTGEYKCISPELGSLVLQKSNLNSFKVAEVKNE